MRVLGVDLSLTSTGLAILDDDPNDDGQPIFSFVKTDPDDGTDMARIGRIVDTVCAWAAKEIDYVILEDFALVMADRSGIFRAGQLAGIVKWELDQMGLPIRTMAPATWKAALFNNGHLPKDEVRLAIYRKYELEHPIQDALDAFCVARAALDAFNIERLELPKYEAKVLADWLVNLTKKQRKKIRGVA